MLEGSTNWVGVEVAGSSGHCWLSDLLDHWCIPGPQWRSSTLYSSINTL